MNNHYLIKIPTDFGIVVKDILDFYRLSKKENLVIALEGDLGAGKTTFTQELAKVLGVNSPVTSPTFTIMKKYELDNSIFDELIHIDAYRLENEDEVVPLHLESLFKKPKGIVCVEWPEKIAKIIPQDALKISFLIGEGENRQVSVTHP